MIVFLVGAGATLAEAIPGQPAQYERPPLDATFFALVRKAGIGRQKTLGRYLATHYGLDPFVDGSGMEEVFNIVYADALSGAPSRGSLDAYWALLGMYRDAIGLTTNRLTGTSHAGIGALLRFFARMGRSDFTFVTFNQDLVIEKAVEAAVDTQRYGHLSWDIRKAYEIAFTETLVLSPRSRREFRTSNPPDSSSIKVLKLHGSLNWVYRVRSAEDAKNALRANRHDLKLLNDKTVREGLLDATGQRNMPLLPFVVPPVYEKSSHIRDVVQPAWAGAREALRNADELVIFGYSCPVADQAARNMIKSAFHQNERVSHVHIIDPNPATAARLGELLKAPVLTQYRGVSDFVAHYPSA